jgi:hypothetical protein
MTLFTLNNSTYPLNLRRLNGKLKVEYNKGSPLLLKCKINITPLQILSGNRVYNICHSALFPVLIFLFLTACCFEVPGLFTKVTDHGMLVHHGKCDIIQLNFGAGGISRSSRLSSLLINEPGNNIFES